MSGQTLRADADVLQAAAYAGKRRNSCHSTVFPNWWQMVLVRGPGAERGREGAVLSPSSLPLRAPVGILAQRQAVPSGEPRRSSTAGCEEVEFEVFSWAWVSSPVRSGDKPGPHLLLPGNSAPGAPGASSLGLLDSQAAAGLLGLVLLKMSAAQTQKRRSKQGLRKMTKDTRCIFCPKPRREGLSKAGLHCLGRHPAGGLPGAL